MKNLLEKVDLFHKTFGVGESSKNYETLPEDEFKLRFELMKEENEEYLEACKNNDIVEIADALGDQLYILCGTILKHGLQDKIEEIFNEIQSSNMSKLGLDGDPILREDGKILKGENYFKPDIESIIVPDKVYAIKVNDKYLGCYEGDTVNFLEFSSDKWCAFEKREQAESIIEDFLGSFSQGEVKIVEINTK